MVVSIFSIFFPLVASHLDFRWVFSLVLLSNHNVPQRQFWHIAMWNKLNVKVCEWQRIFFFPRFFSSFFPAFVHFDVRAIRQWITFRNGRCCVFQQYKVNQRPKNQIIEKTRNRFSGCNACVIVQNGVEFQRARRLVVWPNILFEWQKLLCSPFFTSWHCKLQTNSRRTVNIFRSINKIWDTNNCVKS